MKSGGAALESDLIATLASCQQGLLSQEHNGSSGLTDLLLSVPLRQVECECFVFLVSGGDGEQRASPAALRPSPPGRLSHPCGLQKKEAIEPPLPDTRSCLFSRLPFVFFSLLSAAAPHFPATRPPRRDAVARCEVRCYLSQPSAGGADIHTGVGATAVIDSPCLLLEDAGGRNCVRTPRGCILAVPPRGRGPTGEISFCIAKAPHRRRDWSPGNGGIFTESIQIAAGRRFHYSFLLFQAHRVTTRRFFR